jgi:hypothetical protein
MNRTAATLLFAALALGAIARASGNGSRIEAKILAATTTVPRSGHFFSEPLSRAQVMQVILDHGYFEVGDLRQEGNGTWTCTASSDIGKRVTLTVDGDGNIVKTDTFSESDR